MTPEKTACLVAPGMALSRSRRWYLALALGMMAAFGPLCTDTYLPTLPALSADLGMSTAMTQMTITSCLLGMALGQLFIGPVSDSRGRRAPLFLALILFALASILCVFADSGHAFLALRLVQGLGGAGGIVLSRAIACDLFQGAELTSFMSLLMGIQGVAPIAGPLLGGGIAALGGWPLIFVFLTAFGVILFLMTAFGVPETLPGERRRSGGVIASLRNMGRLFHEKAFLCFAGVQGFTMAGFFGYVAASPFVIQTIYGMSPTAYSLIFGLNAFSIMITALITGRLSRRFGDACLLKLGDGLRSVFCLIVLAVALIGPASPLPLLLALLGMIALQGVTLTASFTLAIGSQRVGAGAASGILGVSTFLFGAFSSPLVGIAGPESAVPLGVVSAVSGVLSLFLSLRGIRGMAAPSGD